MFLRYDIVFLLFFFHEIASFFKGFLMFSREKSKEKWIF